MYVALVLFVLLCIIIYDFIFFSASFRELGPPDLCHVVKSSGRQVAREVLAQYWTRH